MKRLIHKAGFTLAGIFWILAMLLPAFAQTPVGTDIENVAHAQYHDASGYVYSIQSQPVITTVSQGSLLTILKRVEQTVCLPLDTVRYHITLSNLGNLAASSITVTDTLSADLTYISSQPSATVNGRIVSWNLLEIQPGVTIEITLIARVAPGISSGTTIENSANFRTSENKTGSSARVEITIGTLPDLVLKKSVNRLNAAVGDSLIYTITLENIGNAPSTNTILYDDLPELTEFVACSGGGQSIAGIIGWNIGSLAPGNVVEETVTAIIKTGSSPGTIITNIVSVINSEGVNRSALTTTSVIEEVRYPDLRIEKTANLSAEAGTELKYTITYQNLGNGAATNVIITDTLSENVDYVSSTGSSFYDSQTRIATWNIGNLTANMSSSQSVELMVRIRSPLDNGTVITNSATITCDEGTTEQASVNTTVASAPELTLTNVVMGHTAPGDTLAYHLVFANIGNTIATSTVISDSLGAEVDFISASAPYQYESSTRRVTWYPGNLNSGAKDSVEIKVRIRPGIVDGTKTQNAAKITCSEGPSATAGASAIIKSPVLSITKTATNTTIGAGDELKYLIIYRNTGSNLASGVIITDTLAANLNYISSEGLSSYNSQTRIVTWNIGTLTANMNSSDSLDLTVQVKSLLNNGTVIANSAMIKCNEGFTAKASFNVTVTSAPILTLTKTTRSQAYPGDILAYELTFTNSGNAIATQTTITDTLSSLVEFVDASGVHSYDESNHLVKWEIGELTPGVDSTFSLNVAIKPDLSGSHELVNQAWIHSLESSEDSAVARTRIKSLGMHITAEPDSIIGNGNNYADIMAVITDADGQPAVNGTKVIFSTSQGSYTTGTDTVLTLNGIAQTRLISNRIDQATVPVKVKARLENAFVTDSTTVVFYAATIVGIVTDSEQNPIIGAIVSLIYNGVVVDTDTTSATGQYEFPIFESGTYTIIIQITDDEGNTRSIEQTVDVTLSDSGQISTIGERSTISGRLFDLNTQEPINVAGIPVIINEIFVSSLAKPAQTMFSDTTVTDSTGFWSFSNLDLATYSIAVDDNGAYGYNGAQCIIVLDSPGQCIFNVDIALRPIPLRAYKTVNKSQVLSGDDLIYQIYYQALENTVTDTFQIIDQLPPELEWISDGLIHSEELIFDGFDKITNELRFHRFGMTANTADSITIKTMVRTDLSPGISAITNQAFIYSPNDTISTSDDVRSTTTTRIISPFIAVKKVVNRRVVEAGDILTYMVTIENKSTDITLDNLTITDILPRGFRYREKRSAWDGQLTADPLIQISDNRQVLVWTASDTLLPGKSHELKYRVITGLDCQFGENANVVSARSTLPEGIMVTSNEAKAEVILKPGMLQDRGFIFGKVFYDSNRNRIHDQNEETAKGIEIITEEGTRVITDQFGKYSIPNVRTGDHVLRINPKTLPDSVTVALSSADFLGDSTSRLVKMPPGGIAKANFILQKRSNVSVSAVPSPQTFEMESIDISVSRTVTQTDSVASHDDLTIMPAETAFLHADIHYLNQPLGTTIRVIASLSTNLMFSETSIDSLKHLKSWVLPIGTGQRDFELDLEISASTSVQNDQTINIRVETLDDKMVVKGLSEKTFTVRKKQT